MADIALQREELDFPTTAIGAPSIPVWNAFAAVAIDAAVNLTEDRRYHDVPLTERLSRAAAEQRRFLNALLDPMIGAVFDLRIIRRPGEHILTQAILIRATGRDPEEAGSRGSDLAKTVLATMPDHVLGRIVTDEQELASIRTPFEAQIADAAFITREEIVATPTRPDLRQRFKYLYSVVPFGHTIVDWAPLYQRLLAADEPIVISVGLHPRPASAEFAQALNEYATVYGQLAQADQKGGGVYTGEQKLPPEAFAVDASVVFSDYAQRLSQRYFVQRTMIASPVRLPAGIIQAFGGTVSPVDSRDLDHFAARHAASAYGVRGVSEQVIQIARWDLHAADTVVPPGNPAIWQQPAPPPAPLSVLAAIGDAREANLAFRLPIAATGDLPGVRVRRGRSGQAETTTGGAHPVLIGQLVDTPAPLNIDANSLSKHALIAGSTGSGKTSVVLELLRQLWGPPDSDRRRIPFLVIEPVNDAANDYRKLLLLPELEHDLIVFTVGDERFRPLRFNPFAVPPGVLVGEHMASLLSAFKAAFGLFDPLPAIYEEAIAETYAAAGILPSETSGEVEHVWPTVVGFAHAMDVATSGLGYSGDVKANLESASVIRAKQLISGPCASAFRTDVPLDVEWLLDVPAILELKTLGSIDEQALMIALLINTITEHYKANRGSQSELRHVTVIEEAHRLLSSGKGAGGDSSQAQAKEQAAASFANVLAENRKYGEGILIAEQIPTKLVEDAVKNTNLKVMCRLTAEEEREYLGQSMAMSVEQRLAAARLKIGEAMVYSDELASTTEVRTPFTFKDEKGVPLPVPDTITRERTVPFHFCHICESRCNWRPVGLAISRRPRAVTARDEFIKALYSPKAGTEEGTVSPAAASARLAKIVADEVGRYPSIGRDGDAKDAAKCTLVHLLESRVKKESSLKHCSDQVVKQLDSAPEPVST